MTIGARANTGNSLKIPISVANGLAADGNVSVYYHFTQQLYRSEHPLTMSATAESQSAPKDLFGQPRGLYYLFFAEMWERFSFYGMRALLTLYMVEEIFQALANKDTVSAIVYSSYGSLVYASPIIGGRIADQLLGYRRSIMLGGILMALGHFVLAIPDQQVAFFVALAFIIVGNGFFKPNISTFVGALYPEEDTRKDVGFTIFHMGINLGAMSPIICGWLAGAYGRHYGFGLAGIGMLIGVWVFYLGIQRGIFMDKGLAPYPEKLEEKKYGLKVKQWVPVLSFLAVPVIAYVLSSYRYIFGQQGLFGEMTLVNFIFIILLVVILGYLINVMSKVDLAQRKKLIVAIILTFFMTLFWGFHELSGSVLTLFADRNVDMGIFNAEQTNFFNPAFVFLLAIPAASLWTFLGKRRLNPRTPYKYALGLVLLGLGFYVLFLSRGAADPQGMVPLFYLVLMYMLISMGELCLYPIGLSKITDLSPAKIVSFMMGVWFLSSAFAFQIVGVVGKQLAIEKITADGAADTPMATLELYTNGFESITYVCLGGALLALLLAPLIRKWMGTVH